MKKGLMTILLSGLLFMLMPVRVCAEGTVTATEETSGVQEETTEPQTLYVKEDSTSSTEDGTESNPYKTLQAAIDAASNGAKIVVQSEITEESIRVAGKAVYIVGADNGSSGTYNNDFPLTNTQCQTNDLNGAIVYGDLDDVVDLVSDDTFKNAYSGNQTYLFIYLFEDITLTSDITLPVYNCAAASIWVYADDTILDLNGHTIEQGYDGTNGFDGYAAVGILMGSLTIKDSSSDQSGKIIGASYGLVVYNGTKVVLESGTIATYGRSHGNNSYGSVIFMEYGGTFEMTGGYLSLKETYNTSSGSYRGTKGTIYLYGAGDYDIRISGGKIDVVPESLIQLGTDNKRVSDGLICYDSSTITADAVPGYCSFSGGVFGECGNTTGSSTLKWKNTGYPADGLIWIDNVDTSTNGNWPYTVGAQVIVDKTENGIVTADMTESAVGATVTVSATPASGYQLSSLTVTAENGSAVTVNSDNTFTMPACNVTVAAVFVAAYDVNISGSENGSVTVDTASATAGTTVTISTEPASGYQLSGLTVTAADGSTITVNSDNTFTMPASNVTITAVFVPVTYSVSASGSENGSVTVDAASATAGTTVTISTEPASGYQLSSLTVTAADGSAITVDGNTFVMPASDVTITAVFAAIEDTTEEEPAEEAEEETTEETAESTAVTAVQVESAETGDNSNMAAWIAGMVILACFMGITAYAAKKRQDI